MYDPCKIKAEILSGVLALQKYLVLLIEKKYSKKYEIHSYDITKDIPERVWKLKFKVNKNLLGYEEHYLYIFFYKENCIFLQKKLPCLEEDLIIS